MDEDYSERQMSSSGNSVFNSIGLSKMKKVFCKCGEIIDFDSSQMFIKLCLGKELECPSCRNARISKYIDEINIHYQNTNIDGCTELTNT
ncbi:MAG: hypothetical protein MJY64_03060 [archaeon]|nr:hypothetical protein [archaeon]